MIDIDRVGTEPLSLKQFGKDIRKERLEADGDACIGICGDEGKGKSDLEMQLGIGIYKDFDVELNMAYSASHEAVKDKIMNVLKPLSVLGIDEAITSTYKRLFQSKQQIFLNVAYTQCRDHNIASLLCMPDFFDFDKYWRDHRLCSWIQIISRGVAIIFSKDWNCFTTDKWNIRYNEKFIIGAVGKKKVHEVDMENRVRMLLQSKNAIGWVQWEPMKDSPDENLKNMWIRYKELKGAAKQDTSYQDNLGGYEKRHRDVNIKSIKMLYEKGVTQDDIAKGVGVSKDFINRLLAMSGSRKIDKYDSRTIK
jgi:hypothetical protein